jgi:hypothetical protein
MILAEDLRSPDGRLLISRGYELSRTLIQRLTKIAQATGVKEPIKVLVPPEDESQDV